MAVFTFFGRLQQIAQWYYDPTTGIYLDYNQKLAVAILAVKYMLENPTVTWEEYRNQFLTSPCEKAVNEANKAKEIVTNATLNNKIAGIKPSIASDTTEKGFNFGKDTAGNYAVSGTYTGTLTGLSMPSTETDFTPSGSFHTHPDYEGYECFSAADFYQLYVKNKENGNFTTLFVLTATGGIYNLMIADYAKFNSFLTNLPISSNIDPEDGHWKPGTSIRNDFNKVEREFIKQSKTEDEAFALAHSMLYKTEILENTDRLNGFDKGAEMIYKTIIIKNIKISYNEGLYVMSCGGGTPKKYKNPYVYLNGDLEREKGLMYGEPFHYFICWLQRHYMRILKVENIIDKNNPNKISESIFRIKNSFDKTAKVVVNGSIHLLETSKKI